MLPPLVRTTILLFVFIFASKNNFAQFDDCATPLQLTPGTSCSNVSGSLYLATNSGITSTCGTTYDVWYYFSTPANCTAVDIDVADIAAGGSNIDNTNTFIQAFSGANCSTTTVGVCTPMGTTLSLTGLTQLTTYRVRVFTTTNPTTGNTGKWDYNICITYIPPPANDECAAAVTLTNATTNNSGTVWLASASSGIPAGCATGNPDDDVWYKFTPSAINLNISLTSVGANLSASGTRLQLFSGGCGSLTSVACGTTTIITTVTSGTPYYIRVYSAGTGSIGGTTAGSVFSITATATAPVIVTSGRMKEVYQQTTLSGANILADPWEITYGPDNYLWITEAKGYKAYRMDPVSGSKTTILDISQGSTFFTAPADQAFNAQFNIGTNNPQGGFAGLVLHPKFLDAVTPKNYVYISYVHSYVGGSSPTGIFYVNRVVRFTYNTGTGKLESPVSLCDTLPGSNDHNSQRLIIAPVGGTDYLFYGQGDMGAGQFGNRDRPQKSQVQASYEGKILRFNLEADADAGTLDKWIPNDNPFNGATQSAVWSIGIRNNQGFAYDPETGILYGSSHGPYSDDEINIIQQAKNYGHPLVIGYAADNNYNNSTAGAPLTDNGGVSTCPMILDEANNAVTIGASYKDPLFSGYAQSQAVVHNNWQFNTSNGGWGSEAWSGMDIYKHTFVPGWKNSLVLGSLKWGRVLRIKLGSSGTAVIPTDGADTISYFGGQNRFRDIAFGPTGKDIYVVMERSTTSSGPSSANPVVPSCPGCVQKYTFLGYADAAGKSSIPAVIDVTTGTLNSCNTGTTVTIDNINNNLWVPITGPDGNIMAEIYANGQNLGTITSSFYQHGAATRIKNGNRYLNRNMTITPQNQPASPVKIRLYISKAEFDALDIDPLSGITSIGDLKILKNNDGCGNAIVAGTTIITPQYAEAHGTQGYVLQADITGFSSFYFSSSNIILPLDLLSFTGSLQSNNTVLLKWKTENETNTSHFQVERSLDGTVFAAIGNVAANGNSTAIANYSYNDLMAGNQPTLVLYYRLKMVDANGAFKYSNVITIVLADITGKVMVYPNPVRDEARLVITAPVDGKLSFSILDNASRIISQESAQVKKGGGNIITINMDKLAAGVYYIKLSGAGMEENVKIQKL